jgi:flagellar hook-basal body complex protein FliE
MTDRVDINRLLGDMRSLKAQTQVFQRPQGVGDTPKVCVASALCQLKGQPKFPVSAI